jgi:hypothetical protein
VAPATDPVFPLLAAQMDGWTLLIVGAMMFFTWFGLFHEGFWVKSEGQSVTLGGFTLLLIRGRMVDTSSPLPLP